MPLQFATRGKNDKPGNHGKPENVHFEGEATTEEQGSDLAPGRDPQLTPGRKRWILISSNALHWDVLLFLGDGEIMPSGGGGGWEEIARPRDVAITHWAGMSPWRLEVPIMLDGWTERLEAPDPRRTKDPPGDLTKKEKKKWRKYRDEHQPESIQQHIEVLNRLQRPDRHPEGALRPYPRPPQMRVYGKAIPFWLSGEKFVIEEIVWGARIYDESGRTKRQAATIRFMQHISSEDYKIRKRKKRKKDGGKDDGKKKKYTVKKGDTLQSIAAKFYGDPHKWKKIANANHIKNPRSIEKGDVLVIP